MVTSDPADKSDSLGQDTLIIAITASALEEDRAVILQKAVMTISDKPFRENDLFDALVKHLQVKFTYEELEQPAVSLAQRPEVGKLEPMQISSRLAKLSPELLRGLRQATMLGYWTGSSLYRPGARARSRIRHAAYRARRIMTKTGFCNPSMQFRRNNA